MKALSRLLDASARAMLWLALCAGTLMMLHVTIDVIARAVFNRPLVGTNEAVSAIYMVAAAFLPWAWIARSDAHIKVELFTQFAPPRFNAWLDIAVKFLTLAFVSVFTWQTALRAVVKIREGEVWEVAGGFIPVWPSRCILPLAGALMVLVLLARIASDLARELKR